LPQLLPFRGVRSRVDRLLQARHFRQQFHFDWRAPGVLQDGMRHAQVGGRTEILLEVQRLTGVREIVEFAALDGLPNAAFSNPTERHDL
jgi:hypothetical protein